MHIKFYNDAGTINFGGTNSSDFPLKMRAVEGLTPTSKTFTTANFSGQPGQTTTEIHIEPRTITISADMPNDRTFLKKYQQILQILDNEGWLCIYLGVNKRRIKCNCIAFEPGETNALYKQFVIQFICDYPFFEDLDETTRYIFRRVDKINSSFTLPGIFTERISHGDINYNGNAKCEPTIIVEVVSPGTIDNELIIKNNTHNEFIKLDYSASQGEIITIDVENRKIFNDKGDNLLKYISIDTYLDEFLIYPGINDIEVINNDATAVFTVKCIYRNKYIEAVIR